MLVQTSRFCLNHFMKGVCGSKSQQFLTAVGTSLVRRAPVVKCEHWEQLLTRNVCFHELRMSALGGATAIVPWQLRRLCQRAVDISRRYPPGRHRFAEDDQCTCLVRCARVGGGFSHLRFVSVDKSEKSKAFSSNQKSSSLKRRNDHGAVISSPTDTAPLTTLVGGHLAVDANVADPTLWQLRMKRGDCARIV